ncbi:MAG TPA: carboxylesterase family protein [Candidatus Binataceae bacterium]|nr:carboxylesterase family protein [Candidatus Binataceae bacterium]
MPRKSLVLILSLCAILAIAGTSGAIASNLVIPLPPTVHTHEGRITGMTVDGINEFLGIPYAAPPIGPHRWRPPIAHSHFSKPFAATAFGSQCVQPGGAGSEDCLFLNVFTPESAGPTSDLPVMVWIHGGGLTKGDSSQFDPSGLVAQGVIVVTINYRLGYFGFFAETAIDAERHALGNYGLMDQQFALKWVQKNIAGFGGNSAEVTIFGESAGGESVYANVASPTAAGLFRAAISESGAFIFGSLFTPIITLAEGETMGTGAVPSGSAIAASLKCTDHHIAACLRAVPADTIAGIEVGTVDPFVDGTTLTQTPEAAFASGEFNQVPMISGSNHDEYRYFIAVDYDLMMMPLTDDGYPAAVAQTVHQPETSTLVQSLVNTAYPLANYPPPSGYSVNAPLALGALGTDFMFACPVRNVNLALVAAKVPVYAYEFNDETAPAPPMFAGDTLSFPLGDCHTVELQYLFSMGATFTSDEMTLSQTMIDYWTQFAKTLNPNSSTAPSAWPEYGAGGSIESLIAPTPTTEADSGFDTDHQCSSLWNTL